PILEGVLDMLSGRFPSDESAELRPRVVWDRVANALRSREGAGRIALTSGGTIPDRGLYGVFLVGAEPGKGRVGELDEEMVFETHDLDERAARNLLQYLADQYAAAGAVPDDRTIIVERYVDEVGDWRVCVLTPFGGKVHAPWAMAIGAMVRERSDIEIDVLWTDDGIVARFPEAAAPPPAEVMLPDPDRAQDLVVARLSETPLFAARFREAAGRALLLPRRFPGSR